jgi:hypothetical protein
VRAYRPAHRPGCHVSLIFNTINRLANAFDFAWDCDEQVRLGAKVIHRINYRLPRILTR